MANPCKMYFWIKSYLPSDPPPPPPMRPMLTVIWKVLQNPGDKTLPPKAMEVRVSKGLAAGGHMGKDLAYDIYAVLTPGKTQEQIKAMLDDPTWTWKDNALTLSLHCVETEATGEDLPNPFCRPTE